MLLKNLQWLPSALSVRTKYTCLRFNILYNPSPFHCYFSFCFSPNHHLCLVRRPRHWPLTSLLISSSVLYLCFLSFGKILSPYLIFKSYAKSEILAWRFWLSFLWVPFRLAPKFLLTFPHILPASVNIISQEIRKHGRYILFFYVFPPQPRVYTQTSYSVNDILTDAGKQGC